MIETRRRAQLKTFSLPRQASCNPSLFVNENALDIVLSKSMHPLAEGAADKCPVIQRLLVHGRESVNGTNFT
jgi:hypothetical protein